MTLLVSPSWILNDVIFSHDSGRLLTGGIEMKTVLLDDVISVKLVRLTYSPSQCDACFEVVVRLP